MKSNLILKFVLSISIILQITPIKSVEKIDGQEHSHQQLVLKSLHLFESTDRKQWSFKVIRYENEEGDVTSSIETYTPNLDASKQWSLLQQNGRSPSNNQIKKYIKRKVKATKRNEKKADFSIKLRDLIDLDSLVLVKETDSHRNGFRCIY